MVRNDTKLMESAIALAEELHYQRAARKAGISQPMLTKNIQDLEALVGSPLFLRNRRHVLVSEAGQAYVAQARLSVMYGERAVHEARSVARSSGVSLYIGKSPYVDPFLISTLLSIRLPLHPGLKLDVASRYSNELVHDVLDGTLDVAIANHPIESAMITRIQVEETPFYVAMAKSDPLASSPEIKISALDGADLIMFERRLHPVLYDWILDEVMKSGTRLASLKHVTAPEEAFPSVSDGVAVAIVVKTAALLLARSGVTVRPLAHDQLTLKTFLVTRADNDSKVVSELVRALMRKLALLAGSRQMTLPTLRR